MIKSAFHNPPSAAFFWSLAIAMALFHALLALTATTEKSMTSDEIAYLVAGKVYNVHHDYRFHPENGILPQRWVASPSAILNAPAPPTTSEAWRNSDIWNYGFDYFYNEGVLSDELLFAGRATIALFSAATGLLIFGWSRRLFGWRGAFLSLGLFVFCPAFLAHGALATSDVPITFFLLASVGAWWRHLEKPSFGNSLSSVLAFGLAYVTKFSAVLLIPMLGLLSLIWLLQRMPAQGWRSALTRLGISTAIHLAGSWVIIWLFYGCRFAAFAPEFAANARFYRGDWNWILSDLGVTGAVITTLRNWHALPEAFLYGFAFVVQFARERSAFLGGEYSLTGWTVFFPFAFLIKTTLPLLLLLGTGLVAWALQIARAGAAAWRQRVASQLSVVAPLLVLFFVYWGFSLTSHLNIGHRHLLPTYPVLFILIGACGTWVDWRRPCLLAMIVGFTLWHSVESFRIRPHYLAYFNAISGGPANGWRYLVDSSLDWGQDLPGLRSWLDKEAQGSRVFLSYFGTGSPTHEGIRATPLPCLPKVGPSRPRYQLKPGIYAISATMLQQVYLPYRGPWTAEKERTYQQFRLLASSLLETQTSPNKNKASASLPNSTEAQKIQAWDTYEQLRFARLCHYLRARQPDAMIGYSILIYRLNQDEINKAVSGSVGELGAAIEHAITQQQ